LLDGAARQDDSSAEAFALAAAGAFQALRDRGEPILLEPVMSLEVAAHGADMSAIASDLERRGARVMAEFVEGEERTLTAAAPLANLFGYAARLDAISSGRASLAMRFRGYQPVSMTAPVPASALAESPYAQMADQDFSWPNLIPPRDLPAPADPANDR
jgi:elongation factor G